MDPEKLAHWQAADALFDRWLDLPEDERDAWLSGQALAEPVRRRLAQLIGAHERPRVGLDPGGGNLAGARLGEWTLGDELGRGGMAVVCRAWREDGMVRQEAAVKILTLGALGATGRERFHREAEILARLNHPNVTALVDSGVADDGTCWLAMPLVDGERIDRWCDEHALDAHAIVRLYLQVCGAVAYAHRNLVIHRDIKPSNVLVDAGGHVRLLDFGIGQFADAEGDRTQTMWRALTPGYAAPEQLRGDPPTTAVDVYGLGALLHRLLTGRTPNATTETDTTRPSLLVRDASDAYHRHYVPLKSDLDRVLLKALAEEPGQRYATADALADDLRRWLDGQPVLAEKPGLGYRARKFVARNKAGVAAGVLLAASVAAGVGATLWQAGEARREAENAQVQAQRAILVRDFLEEVFTSTEPAVGDVPDALELLEEGARRARSELLADDPLAAADILILTGVARKHLSRYDLAEADLDTAVALLEKSNAAQGPGARELVLAKLALAEIYWNTGRLQEGIDASERAVAIGTASGIPREDLLDAKLSVAQATAYLDPEASAALARGVLDEALAAGFSDTYLHRDILQTLGVAIGQIPGHSVEEILAIAEDELRVSRLVDGEQSGWYAYRLANNSRAFLFAGQAERAGEMLAQAVDIVDVVYKQPHQIGASIHCDMAAHLHLFGELDRAMEHYDRAAEIDRAIDRTSLSASECARYRGIINATMGRYARALEELDRAESLRVLNNNGQSAIGRSICGMRASIRLRLGAVDQASHALEQCQAGPDAGPAHIYTLAEAEVRMAQGRLEEASKLLTELRQRIRRGLDNSWMRPWMLSLLLAEKSGDAEALATLAAEAAELAADAPPLANCLAATTEANCMAIP